MVPIGYNNNVQLFQTEQYVVIFNEMVHDSRVVPLDGRPHLPDRLRQWMGDSRGQWEGDTLVVETTNFTDKTSSFSPTLSRAIGTGANLTLVERFTRFAADTLRYEYTVTDPSTFTRSFTAGIEMQLSEGSVYEYACHEENHGLENILSGARAEKREAAGGKLFCMANGTHGHARRARKGARNARVWIMGAGTSGAHLMIAGR